MSSPTTPEGAQDGSNLPDLCNRSNPGDVPANKVRWEAITLPGLEMFPKEGSNPVTFILRERKPGDLPREECLALFHAERARQAAVNARKKGDKA